MFVDGLRSVPAGCCLDSTFAGAMCGTAAGVAAVLCNEGLEARRKVEVRRAPAARCGFC